MSEFRYGSAFIHNITSAAAGIASPQRFYQIFTQRVVAYEMRWASHERPQNSSPLDQERAIAQGVVPRHFEQPVPYFQMVQTREDRYLTVVWETLRPIIELSANPPEGVSGPRLQLPELNAPEEIRTWMEDPQNWIHFHHITMGSLPLSNLRHDAILDELDLVRSRAEAGLNGVLLPPAAHPPGHVDIFPWDGTRWRQRRFALLINMPIDRPFLVLEGRLLSGGAVLVHGLLHQIRLLRRDPEDAHDGRDGLGGNEHDPLVLLPPELLGGLRPQEMQRLVQRLDQQLGIIPVEPAAPRNNNQLALLPEGLFERLAGMQRLHINPPLEPGAPAARRNDNAHSCILL
jgi:hypothetical protein